MTTLQVGFYGKLPSHGDFLRRRVSDPFVDTWDAWLQASLAASREALGDRWLQVYLTSPAWRFACAPGACGPVPVAGVMAPSVDRVGRYVPLAIVAELPHVPDPVAAMAEGDAFFGAAERLIVETLAEEPVDFARFDEGVAELGRAAGSLAARPPLALDPMAAAMLRDTATGSWQVTIGSPTHLQAAFRQVLSHRLAALFGPVMIWSTDGSSVVDPCCLVTRGLPEPDTFVALLDGSWRERRWHSVPASFEPAGEDADTLVGEEAPPRYRSVAATHVGCVRQVNQDAFLERPDAGVWVVADGLGGLSDGEVASRMVCDALADVTATSTFDAAIEAVRSRIGEVNTHLVQAAVRPIGAVRSGSTVVALLARGGRCAVVWAGDSRAYRCRDGELAQLTRDHGLSAEEGGEEAPHVITRAVGGEAGLELDVERDQVRPGDRFLLCSDGLTRTVPEASIRTWLLQDDLQGVAEGLIAAAIDAGAPDNVTALIVEASAP